MAQKLEQGSLALLNNVGKANFQIEFLSIHGMTENDFSKYEADWETDKPTVVAIFTDYANRKLKGKLLLGNFPKEKYTVKAIVTLFESRSWAVNVINKSMFFMMFPLCFGLSNKIIYIFIFFDFKEFYFIWL